MANKELYPVVDNDDNVLYLITGKDVLHIITTGYHRGVHLFIETFGGGFVLQKKAKHTENGGKWSSAVSGHVVAGESYESAIIREANEELGLDIALEELYKVVKIEPDKWEETNGEFVVLFTYLLDQEREVIRPSSDEISELITCPREKIIKDIEENKSEYSPVFVTLFNLFLTLEGGLDQDLDSHLCSIKRLGDK